MISASDGIRRWSDLPSPDKESDTCDYGAGSCAPARISWLRFTVLFDLYKLKA